ncbi:DUF5320 domain-containing protein [Candidatus Gracilibacteria bacterium]|nr:DUF5320 domain-containing protein [Candidatus Gracilibacteria bacterium]
MPNLDGTGPAGRGLRTGLQMGKCSNAKPNSLGQPQRRRRNRFASLEEEQAFLEQRLEALKKSINAKA